MGWDARVVVVVGVVVVASPGGRPLFVLVCACRRVCNPVPLARFNPWLGLCRSSFVCRTQHVLQISPSAIPSHCRTSSPLQFLTVLMCQFIDRILNNSKRNTVQNVLIIEKWTLPVVFS
jgi:hypothetical protein